jgi:tetratricopeptide (TPR) repeat protein
MNNERWSEVKAILAEILESSAPERLPVLDRLCGDDADLRKAVESLLEVETRANEPMDSAAVPGAALRRETMAPQPVPPPAWQSMDAREAEGSLIDRYRLLQKIGEGGMGEVWLAEQREPLRRRVALKLVLAGMNTREVIARFESERQALALMDHPAIAKVFDAGSAPQGTPYFVMEYVAGVPITAYCDDHGLSTRDRLELFRGVCEGVQHAHQKAIIHRDLKPSNILVAEVDGKAVPKIIDFGLAKALTQRLTEDTLFTRVGALVGTPEYMSPEQANSLGEDIDTRTDVYSLGIILYELLAGVPPIELRKISFEEFLRRLREDEPPTPSTRIRTQDPATAAEVARKRRTEPVALAKQMRGDLDSIALKALEKDRSRRYGSPAELAADIGRYLRNEAVLAVAPSAAYRARKFVRRHRGSLVSAAAFVLVLLVATAVSIRQGLRANEEAAVAQAVNDFLQNDLLAQASAYQQSQPNTRPDPDLRIRTALDRAAARIEGKFAGQPLVEASIRETIGRTYLELGLYRAAQRQVERALELRRRLLGEEHADTLTSMNSLVRIERAQGSYAEAEPLAAKVLEGRRHLLGAEHPDTIRSMSGLASIYYWESKYALAESLEVEALDAGRRIWGEQHPDTLGIMFDLAGTYKREGKYPQAEPLFIRVLELRRRISGEEHPETLGVMNNLAGLYYEQGRFAQAEPLWKSALEIRGRILGKEHPDTLQSRNNMALLYVAQGKYAQAQQLYEGALEVRRRISGAGHISTLILMNNLADLYGLEGRYAQAEALFNESLKAGRRALGEEHEVTLDSLMGLADMHRKQGRYAQAEAIYANVLQSQRRALGDVHPDTVSTFTSLGRVRMLQRKYNEAETALRYGLRIYEKSRPDSWERYSCQSMLGASLTDQKKFPEAEPLLVSGYEGIIRLEATIPAPERDSLHDAAERIVQLYLLDWGKQNKVAEWRARLKAGVPEARANQAAPD